MSTFPLMVGEPIDGLDKKIRDLDISVRASNCLDNNYFFFLVELSMTSEAEMLAKGKNFGRKSLSEMREVLEENGSRFGGLPSVAQLRYHIEALQLSPSTFLAIQANVSTGTHVEKMRTTALVLWKKWELKLTEAQEQEVNAALAPLGLWLYMSINDLFVFVDTAKKTPDVVATVLVGPVQSPITLEAAHGTLIVPRERPFYTSRTFTKPITLFELLTRPVVDLEMGGRETRLLAEIGAKYVYQAVQVPTAIGRKGFSPSTERRIDSVLGMLGLARGMAIDPALIAALEEYIAAKNAPTPMSPEDIALEDIQLINRERELRAQLLSVRAMRAALGTVQADSLPSPLPPRAQKAFDSMRKRVNG